MTNEKQNKYDIAYLKIAREWGKLSYCKRRQVGAIIVKNNMIISDGYNGTPSGFENVCEDDNNFTKWYVLHAEANAITKLAQSNESSKDAVLFCTHEPCIDCAKLIHQSGIKHVIYKNSYDADKGSGLEFLEKSGCNVEKIRVDNES